MQEILFRGKHDKKYDKNQNWVYGVPYFDFDNDCIMATDNTKSVVIPETVGQYTGLTDKNGKKIFEGDVVEFLFNESLIRGKVFYTENDTAFCVWYRLPEQKLSINSKILCNCGDIEVIGNIHDNPELLEVTE